MSLVAAPPPLTETWNWIDSGLGEPAFNMALDEVLLDEVTAIGRPVLRFYGWSTAAATFGYSQKYSAVATLTPLRPLIRRPTGGGVVPHDHDWTYSLMVPPGHPWYDLRARESYARVHEWVRDSLGLLGLQATLAPQATLPAAGQCFARAEQFDVLWQQAKIAGAAQRRNRRGLLIQGSIQPGGFAVNRADWQEAMRRSAARSWGVTWRDLDGRERLVECAVTLAARKYALPAHNRSR